MKHTLTFFISLALFGCGKAGDISQQTAVDLATISAGTYAVKSLEVTATGYKNESSAVIKHRFSTPGVISRDDNKNFVVTNVKWDARDVNKRLYVWLNLPAKMKATGSKVTFADVKFYKPYADAAGGNLVVWDNDLGARFHDAYTKGKKGNGHTYSEESNGKLKLTAYKVSEAEVSLGFEVEFPAPPAAVPVGFPSKYVGNIVYVKQ